MDIGNSLMNQIRMQNAPQAQLIDQANSEATRLQNMPAQNPMGPALMKFGLGIMGASPDKSTTQAIGLAGQDAMKTYEEQSQRDAQNRMQSIALRQTAANTIDAVKKFNMEMEYKNRSLRTKEAGVHETARHNQMLEYLKGAELGNNNPNNKLATENINNLIKDAKNYKNYESVFRSNLNEAPTTTPGIKIPTLGNVGENKANISQNNKTVPAHMKLELGNSTEQTVKNAGIVLLNYAKSQVIEEAINTLRNRGLPDSQIENILSQQREKIDELAKQQALKIHEEENKKREMTAKQKLNPNT